MENERKARITQLITEGNGREAIRRILVSQGESAATLNEEYDAIAKELGMPIAPPPMPKRVAVADRPDVQEFIYKHRALRWKKVFSRFLVGICILALLGGAALAVKMFPLFLYNGNPVPGTAENQGLGDVLLRSKVETTAASAKIYVGRMGFYDGVCKDITVVEPVVCKNSSEYFMLYVPLAAGGYYCIDSNNYSGEVSRPKETRCQ